MRYSLLAGVLAASVYAAPAVVTDVAYVTQVVTVTAGNQAAPTPTHHSEVSVAAVPSSKANKWWHWKWTSTSEAAAPTKAAATHKVTAAAKPSTYAKPSPKPSKTSTKAPASTPSSSGGEPSFSDIVVMHHNLHRKNHSAPDMTWDQGLADTAQAIGESCNYAHNVDMNGGGYGQNIAAGAPAKNVSSIITDHFYNDELPYFEPFFGEATPSDMSDATFDKFGHFSQIVWKGSHKVGCAVVDCTGKGNGPNGLGSVADNVPPYFTVCNYSPPGNYLGEFDKNVAKGNGEATQNWSWGL